MAKVKTMIFLLGLYPQGQGNVVGQKVIQPTIRVASLIGLKGFDNKENGLFLLRFQITKGINSCRLISVTQHRANYYYIF